MEFAVYPSLKGKAVFVTGGASGIGADIVRAFTQHRVIQFCRSSLLTKSAWLDSLSP